MNLYAISDLHVGYSQNREELTQLPAYPDDWLIVAGDIGESLAHFHWTLQLLTERFAKVIWVPGNHDLWTLPKGDTDLRGAAKYLRLVKICREYGVLTPEDPYIKWEGGDFEATLVPTFTLYDYSFRPKNQTKAQAIANAKAENIVCVDEALLYPAPYRTREAWCAARCAYTEERLATLPPDEPLILINHYPLRQDLAYLPRIPEFRLWCGTKRTEAWLEQFPVKMVIFGHLHIPQSKVRDGVRFEEVSFGYPRQREWRSQSDIVSHLRRISLP